MALKKSGVVLVAENYQQYMNQMRAINKAHKEAFSGTTFKNYNQASQQFTQSSKKMKQAADDTWNTVQNLRNQFNSAAKEANSVSSGISKLGGAFSGATGGIKSMFSGITGLIGKLGILAAAISAVMAIVNFGKASVEVAARNETLAVSLNVMGKEYGYTQQQVDYATESLKKQGITTSAARQSLIKMARANIEWSEASKLAAIAQGAAVVSGMNSSQAFERLVTGVQKMEPELLDELGITLNRTNAYEKFAKTLGVNAKSLTQQQKQQAILNEIYEQSAPVLGVYGAAMETAGKQQGSLSRHIEETQNSLGQLLLPFKTIWVEWQTTFWKDMREITKGMETWVPILTTVITQLKLLSGEGKMPPDVKQSYKEVADKLKTYGLSAEEARGVSQKLMEQLGKGAKKSDMLDTLIQGFMDTGDSAEVAKEKAILAINSIDVSMKNAAESAKKMGEIDTFGEVIGKKAQEVGRTFVLLASIVAAAMTTIKVEIKKNSEAIAASLDTISTAWELLKSGEFTAAKEVMKSGLADMKDATTGLGTDFKDTFGKVLPEAFEVAQQMFPTLFADFDELGDVAETNLDRTEDAVDDVTDALADMEAQLGQLEASLDAMQQIENLQKNFNKNMEKLDADHQKAMADENTKYQKDIAKENKKYQKDLEKAEKKKNESLEKAQQTYEKSVAKLQQDARRDDAKQQKDHYRDMENERRRFELEQLQATRQFKVQDRRLRAEGDILGLMDLREDFKLQQQAAKENFELGQNEAQTSFQDERKQRQDDIQARMAELKTELEERKTEVNKAYEDELADLHEAHNDQLVSLQDAHQERIQQMQEQYEERKAEMQAQYEEQLEELGKSLADEKDLTKEGMEAIAEEMSKLFGDEGIGDALIKGWSERTQSEIGKAVKNTKEQIEELKVALKEGTPIETVSPATSFNQQGIPTAPGMPNIPMRQGGVGVVTGPATFSVEPGQREAFMFNPLPSQSSSMDVNMSGGFDIRGGENAGKAAVEEALSTMTEEFRIAVTKFARRRGGN